MRVARHLCAPTDRGGCVQNPEAEENHDENWGGITLGILLLVSELVFKMPFSLHNSERLVIPRNSHHLAVVWCASVTLRKAENEVVGKHDCFMGVWLGVLVGSLVDVRRMSRCGVSGGPGRQLLAR
jgi:hypothetical protein